MMGFEPYLGNDLMGLDTGKEYLNYIYTDPGCKILFSITRKGNAAYCHMASNKKGLRKVTEAITAFCDFVFYTFPWCEFIMTETKRRSIARVFERIGAKKVWGHEINPYYGLWIKER